MKTRILLTAVASSLALAACNQNQATETDLSADAQDAAMENAAASTTGPDAGLEAGSGQARSAGMAGSEASTTTTTDMHGEVLTTESPERTRGVEPVPSVQQQKDDARAILSPAGASSGATAPTN